MAVRAPVLNFPRHHRQRSERVVFARPKSPARARKAIYCERGTACRWAGQTERCARFHPDDELRGWPAPDLAVWAVREQLLADEPLRKTAACSRGDRCPWVLRSHPGGCPRVHPCEGGVAEPEASIEPEPRAPPPTADDFPPLPRRERVDEDKRDSETSSSGAESSPEPSPALGPCLALELPPAQAGWAAGQLLWLDGHAKQLRDTAARLRFEHALAMSELATTLGVRAQVAAALERVQSLP